MDLDLEVQVDGEEDKDSFDGERTMNTSEVRLTKGE
jgi:hypothetical protein